MATLPTDTILDGTQRPECFAHLDGEGVSLLKAIIINQPFVSDMLRLGKTETEIIDGIVELLAMGLASMVQDGDRVGIVPVGISPKKWRRRGMGRP